MCISEWSSDVFSSDLFTNETTQYGFTPTPPAEFSDIISHMESALVAHDGKKAEIVRFLVEHISLLKEKNIRLIATGTTGVFVERAVLTVEKMLSGPRGGDAQIASRVAEGRTEMVIFFRYTMDKHPH